MAQKVDIDVGDDVPVIDVIIDGQTISNAYIDGGASINVMSGCRITGHMSPTTFHIF